MSLMPFLLYVFYKANGQCFPVFPLSLETLVKVWEISKRLVLHLNYFIGIEIRQLFYLLNTWKINRLILDETFI